MSSCSLYKPRAYPLLSRAELETLLVFERVVGDWVREVHMFTSKRKKGKIFVMFRNSSNTCVRGVAEFCKYLQAHGTHSSFLSSAVFSSGRSASMLSNKVGANTRARREARMWIQEVQRGRVMDDTVQHKGDVPSLGKKIEMNNTQKYINDAL